jgi:hypothetical protein
MKLKAGDTITCKLKDAVVVSPYSDFDETKSFLIIAVDTLGYYLYVPHYFYVKYSVVVDKYKCRNLGIELKFLDEEMVYIQDNMVNTIERQLDGMSCQKCKEFFQYAKPNQTDGSLICYICLQHCYH